MDMNNVSLTGRLVKDIELKYTGKGEAVANFSLAVNRNFTNQQGERETDFINCVLWNQSAENLAKFASKGSRIGIEGNIRTRNYENQQGQRVYVTEISVKQFYLLESRNQQNENQNSGHNAQKNTQTSAVHNNNSYAQNNHSNNNYAKNNYNGSSQQQYSQYNQNIESFEVPSGTSQIDIKDDDLPF